MTRPRTFNDRLISFMSEQANVPAATKIKPTQRSERQIGDPGAE
jgi:hypothetical protein